MKSINPLPPSCFCCKVTSFRVCTMRYFHSTTPLTAYPLLKKAARVLVCIYKQRTLAFFGDPPPHFEKSPRAQTACLGPTSAGGCAVVLELAGYTGLHWQHHFVTGFLGVQSACVSLFAYPFQVGFDRNPRGEPDFRGCSVLDRLSRFAPASLGRKNPRVSVRAFTLPNPRGLSKQPPIC